MTQEEVEKIIVEQGQAATKRQTQLRKTLIGAFIYITVLASVFGIVMVNQANSVSNLSDTLNRRSPVLEYMRCHDRVDDARDGVQTRFLLALLDAGDNPTPEQRMELSELRRLYERAELKLSAASDPGKDVCPDFPFNKED